MKFPVKQKSVTCISIIGFVILLTTGQGIFAAPTPNESNSRPKGKTDSSAQDAIDPNEFWWKKWDAVVKNPDDPNELAQAKLSAVITILQSQETEQSLKGKIIDKIISPIFDFELMSKLVLGRTHWPKLTPAQQKKFTELFTVRLKSSYLEKITLYKNEKIELSPAITQKTGISFSMNMLSEDNQVTVLYKLRKVDSQWKIYDVEVQGVSILLTYRSQFDDILGRGGIENVITQLETPAAN